MIEKLKNALLIIAVLVLLAAGGAAAAVFIWESGGRDRPFSSHGTLPLGSKAFYLLLEESGLPVQRWNNPLTMLQDGAGKEVLLIVEPGRRPVQRAEAEAARGWVEEGNRLILLGVEQPALFEAFGLEMEAKHYFAQGVKVEPDSDHPLLEGVRRLDFNRGGSFTAAGGGIPLAADGENTYVLWKAVGSGELICVTDPGLITNRSVGRGDNLIFLLNAAGAFDEPRAIFIDEYHHGFGAERPVRIAAAQSRTAAYLSWPAAQLALFTVLLLAALGKRFAAPRPLPVPSPRALAQTVAAAAAIYRRAAARKTVFAHLYAGLKRRITRKYRLKHDPGPGELAALGERVTGLERTALEADFARFEGAARDGNISAADLFDLSRRIDRYRKEFNL